MTQHDKGYYPHDPRSRLRATVERYKSIGFEVTGTHAEDDEMSWARLSFGDSSVMFNEGGQSSDAHRREVDLYIQTENIDKLFKNLKDRVEVFEAPHDTFYEMREFIIRDLNRFWLTFGEPIK
jgi:uncharacterized glyoxalase superfamily protein PhnB